MLFGFLVTLFIIVSLFLILIILLQKGKSSTGLGSLGGSTQMLFGGSGGQDIFEKITWVLAAFFMFGSLALALMKSSSLRDSRFLARQRAARTEQSAQQPFEQPVTTPDIEQPEAE